MRIVVSMLAASLMLGAAMPADLSAQRTNKPVLHGSSWVAVTGKPLGAAAGAMIFAQGGNAIDAACAMLASVATLWDTMSWGGETQALIYNPNTKKVIGINALGVAPSGATAEFYHAKGYRNPPEYGPLAAVTPGTPGGLMTMLAEYGTMSLEQVLAPAIRLADGYAIDAQTANSMEGNKRRIKQWTYSPAVFLPHLGEAREAPEPGEIFVQTDLAVTLRKLVDAERAALRAGKSRKEAIMAAYDRFYKGDIADELVRGVREQGGLFTKADLANWRVKIEEPYSTTYKGIEVFKLQQWTQGPALLQALNILENADVASMGYNSSRYIHTVYQAMSMAFADRDFYYGDPAFAPHEPMDALLSKAYAKSRYAQMDHAHNDAAVKPGDPYAFRGAANPFKSLLDAWSTEGAPEGLPRSGQQDAVVPQPSGLTFEESFTQGTTSIQAADSSGWVISITPSGGWIPAVIGGRTGVGLSQRAQSFVTLAEDGPYNVIEPGKRPRVTLTPTLALQDGAPYMAFSVQGGDTQDQNLLQFFLNVVEFGMTPQQAAEAANVNSYQMRSSFGAHESRPGRILLRDDVPGWVRADLRQMGYSMEFEDRTSGPITAIWLDRKHGTMWGAASNYGDDYGIAW
ncbi:MAG TPA: gamma-glutamyltransferase [Gemmatimonadaceae bacterium]|nr:gamma-glutamyltransferase [Gemmatimonadaceae bacterium]